MRQDEHERCQRAHDSYDGPHAPDLRLPELGFRFGSVQKSLALSRMSEIESDRVPQHDPPPGADLVQPEVDERHDSLVVEGEDRDHVLPPTELDPYTPEVAPPARARAAMWIAIAILLAVALVVVIAAVR